MDAYVKWRYFDNFPGVLEIKEACGLTWDRLAELMGVTQRTIFRYAKGEWDIPLKRRILFVEIYEDLRRKDDKQ